MMNFTQGNLLEAKTESLVNTVNTVGVMGKGIALMFKDRFPDNYRQYVQACRDGRVVVGKMFITEPRELDGPQWVVNFPTKQHWRSPSRLEWITTGLHDLRRFLIDQRVKSVAIPPLGAGNGGLAWPDVRQQIEAILGGLDTNITVYEPTNAYQNVSKRTGVQKLTPARALVAELVRQYWVLGMECSLLEIQKLAWFLERMIEYTNPTDNPLDLRFEPYRYGPYASRLSHLLNHLDGSYLHCDKRIGDASPYDVIWFDEGRKDYLHAYLRTEAASYQGALERTVALISGFESPFGLELLATVDWLLSREGVRPDLSAVREGLVRWPADAGSGERKNRLFDDHALCIAIDHLTQMPVAVSVQ